MSSIFIHTDSSSSLNSTWKNILIEYNIFWRIWKGRTMCLKSRNNKLVQKTVSAITEKALNTMYISTDIDIYIYTHVEMFTKSKVTQLFWIVLETSFIFYISSLANEYFYYYLTNNSNENTKQTMGMTISINVCIHFILA